jgi:hypothetical protein
VVYLDEPCPDAASINAPAGSTSAAAAAAQIYDSSVWFRTMETRLLPWCLWGRKTHIVVKLPADTQHVLATVTVLLLSICCQVVASMHSMLNDWTVPGFYSRSVCCK